MSAATIRVFHKLWHRSIYPKPCSFTLFPPPPTQLRHPLPFSLPPPLAAIIPTLVSSAQRTPHFCTPSSLRLRRRNVQKISLNARSLVMRQWALKEREGNSPDFVPPSPSPHLVVCLPTKGDEEKMESSRARRVWRRLIVAALQTTITRLLSSRLARMDAISSNGFCQWYPFPLPIPICISPYSLPARASVHTSQSPGVGDKRSVTY